jgi:hypothetical protein
VFENTQESVVIDKQKAAINPKRLVALAIKQTVFLTPAF